VVGANGVHPMEAACFWYAYAHPLEPPGDERYSFFIVANGKIVRERVNMFDDRIGLAKKPSIQPRSGQLTRAGSDLRTDDAGWRDAQLRYWYRKSTTTRSQGR
jgi:hypothetical protein